MRTHAEFKKKNKAAANNAHKNGSTHKTTVQNNHLQQVIDNSPQVRQYKAFQGLADEALHSGNGSATQLLKAKQPNRTGIPDNIKSNIEHLSGYSMDDVKVHYNSEKPTQLNAHAYAQGSDIHIAPGQEKHLGHEAWHVVQQKQGRVAPTLKLKSGVNINNNPTLEQEADKMGAIVQRHSRDYPLVMNTLTPTTNSDAIQRVEDIEMNAGEEDLENNYKRKIIVDRIYSYIKKNNLMHEITNLIDTKAFIKNAAEHKKAFSQFQSADDGKQTAMTKEILARKYHDSTATAEITPEMRGKLGTGQAISPDDQDTDGPDITASTVKIPNKKEGRENFEIDSKMTTAKACVITALMFSEGGGVLGAKSVEELHFILSTRFGSTWRHYSDDAVYKSLYEHLGYSKSVPQNQTRLENLSNVIGNKRHGMVSIGGHMIGFKMDDELHIRDNDEGLKKPNQHSKKLKQITAIWTK
ncbi:hypothetical protein C900_04387 [Fulvivirga imtechensis AK7]|uniref:eCIS core domain-containing protein n=1 Tax=Fulvivirga imtechensis AK7 TaxID=1237149 RepID=L8JRM7_9BACT|nr:DUF4157 domain-containing protein [Fulvivirga imtechensis]ELR70017.1 hypothetical protein C900_04387 [Fulvivirga imtechensis AK7]